MAKSEVGEVKAGSGRTYTVIWDNQTGQVFVRQHWGGGRGAEQELNARVKSVGDAMSVAETSLRDK